MQKRRRNLIIGSALAVALTLGGGGAWALDRFVVEHVEITDVDSYEAQQTGSTTSSDGTADISVQQYSTGSGSSTVTYYVADVTLSDATVLRSAFAQNMFGENIIENTSAIAADNDAVFAINGDYYGFRDSGIVIRNGVVYRDAGAREGLAFYSDGSVDVYDETQTTAAELVAAGVWNTLSFGPALVEPDETGDGAVVDGIAQVEVDTNIGNHSIQGDQPRTIVGVIDENHLLFVVIDGRDPGYSAGMTMTEAAELMVSLGATTAYNLDGGGSSTMYYDGEVVNQPSNGGERGTSDILYIATSAVAS
ncbi:MAG: phosphodiester glycosidase family protein [Pseudolysinimonas sp.]